MYNEDTDSSTNSTNSNCALYRKWIEETINGKSFASVSLGIYEEDGSGRTCTVHVGEKVQPTDTSLFEIGSITKVFTALLLALAVGHSGAGNAAITLDTPLRQALPASSTGPRYPEEITLKRLSTHSAGLPRLPPSFTWWYLLWHRKDPYAAYHERQLVRSLRKYQDKEPDSIGSRWVYSNYGVGLLGYTMTKVLSIASPSSRGPLSAHESADAYDALVQDYITRPLGLTDTTIALDEEQEKRFLPGYSDEGRRMRRWTFDALAGAGALRSSLENLLDFGVENVRAARETNYDADSDKETSQTYGDDTQQEQDSDERAALRNAMRLTHQVHFTIPDAPDGLVLQMGLGWLREPLTLEQEEHQQQVYDRNKNATLFIHDGGTAGFSSFMGWEPATGNVVVLLVNAQLGIDVSVLGKRIILHQVQQSLSMAAVYTVQQHDEGN